MCSCRGPSACKQGRRIYNTLLLQAMALYIHGPLRCKNLLGRIPNPHSSHALAAPRPTYPAAAPAGERPALHTRPRSDRPAASRTHAAHTHPAQIRHPAAHAGSCAAPTASHDQPPNSTKARPTIKPDRLFLLHDETGNRPAAAIRQDATALSKPVAAPGRS